MRVDSSMSIREATTFMANKLRMDSLGNATQSDLASWERWQKRTRGWDAMTRWNNWYALCRWRARKNR